jgi:hypothetical protein
VHVFESTIMQRLVYTTTTHYRNEDVTASNVKNITIFVGTALIVVVGSRVKIVSFVAIGSQPANSPNQSR